MPSSTLGWTRAEIISKILDSCGRSSDATLQNRLKEDLNMGQLAFWKMLDWKFGMKDGVQDTLRFLLVNGTSTYTLNTATIGKEMRATDIEKIFATDAAYARTLTKATSREIRSWDPQRQSTGFPEFYFIDGHNRIDVWPIPDANAANKYLYIDGKVMPTFMTVDGDYPDIPIEFQETYIQYMLARTLTRERDPRASEELQVFQSMLRGDMNYDLKEIESNLRFRTADEEYALNLQRPNLYYTLWNSD